LLLIMREEFLPISAKLKIKKEGHNETI
jgi:hypothetical protein